MCILIPDELKPLLDGLDAKQIERILRDVGLSIGVTNFGNLNERQLELVKKEILVYVYRQIEGSWYATNG